MGRINIRICKISSYEFSRCALKESKRPQNFEDLINFPSSVFENSGEMEAGGPNWVL